MTGGVFLTKDIVRILEPYGVAAEGIKTWLHLGLVVPSVQKGNGRGTRNIFSFDDLIFIALFKKLVDLGAGREEASHFLLDSIDAFSELARRNKKLYLISEVHTDVVTTKRGKKEFSLKAAFFENIDTKDIDAGSCMVLSVISVHGIERQIRESLGKGIENA